MLSRRDVLRGMGASIALPFLEVFRQQPSPVRLICIEQVHGAAGSSPYGWQNNLWAPAATGRDFDLTPTSLKPLERFRDHLTIISNCDVPSADPTDAREIGADHFRSSATYLTQRYPKRLTAPISNAARQWTSCTRNAAAGTRRSRRSSCASRTSTRLVAACTDTRARTRTRSAGRHRRVAAPHSSVPLRRRRCRGGYNARLPGTGSSCRCRSGWYACR